MKPKKLRNIKILILFILLGTILFSIIIINDKDKYSPRFSDMLPNLSEIFLLSFFIGGTMGFFLSILFINPKFYKPTKWKIILTIILTLIIIYYSLTKNSMCPLWMLQCPEGKQAYIYPPYTGSMFHLHDPNRNHLTFYPSFISISNLFIRLYFLNNLYL